MKKSSKFLILIGLLFTVNLYAQEVVKEKRHGIDYTGYKLFRVDMNNDGRKDEVFVGSASVMTHFATRHGKINDVRIETEYCTPSKRSVYEDFELSVQDINGDHIPDLVFTSKTTDKKTYMHRGRRDGFFDKITERLTSN